MERIVAVSGSLAPQEQATISVKVSGRVKTMAVDIGSAVPQGELIAQIEPRDYELRLQQAAAALAQARALVGLPLDGADDHFDPDRTSAVLQTQALLEEASRNHDRIESLFRNGVLAKSELDAAQSAHTVALNRHAAAVEEARTRQAALAQRRAEFEIAKQQIADTTVRAPFTGIIQSRLVSPGEFLSAGAPVVQLVQGDPLRLRLQVPEREAIGVRQGQFVRLTVEGDANIYTGTLARISPAIDERARVLFVEADVPSHGALRPGLFARAQIITRADDPGLSVPLSALVVFAGIEKVLTVRDGKAVERPVTTGRRGAGWVEIASGLRAGEPVVSNPGNLRSGQPVVVSASGPEPAERASVPSGP
jgi:RND family efflux transporter MFP subunit